MSLEDGFFQYIRDRNDLNMFRRNRRSAKVYMRRFDPMSLEEKDFETKYRFTKENMWEVIDIIRENLVMDKRGGNIPVDLQVMAAIRYWGRNEIQDDCADIHGFSQQTMSRICRRVAVALASKAKDIIKMPTTLTEQNECITEFFQIGGFLQVIGAIDCTHIKIRKVGGDIGQYYINRKGYFSINTQVVCDANLKIRDIVCHWRGSTHDARIFRESSIRERFEADEFKGRLLGDEGYACTKYLFTPLLQLRTQAEQLYNRSHITTRNVVERCFGVWKQRFRILLDGMRGGSLHTIKTTVVALAVLHNLAIEFKEISVFDRTYQPPTITNHGDEGNPYEVETANDVTRAVFINIFFQ